MSYKNIQIYYTTGTGNTLRVAEWMVTEASKNGINTKSSSIEYSKPDDEIMDSKENLLILGAPAHGFSAPWHMIKFVLKLPRVKDMRAFVYTTRGGLKLGPLFLPGLSGSAIFLFSLIMLFKGYKPMGGMAIDMPLNWQNVFPTQKAKNYEEVIKRAKLKVEKLCVPVINGKSYWISLNNVYEFIFGISLIWFSILYIYIGRPFMAKLFFASNKCTSCGICEADCPVNGVKLLGKKIKKPYWTKACESCMRCMAFCPSKAIEANHVLGIILFYLGFLPVTGAVLPHILQFEQDLFGFQSELVIWLFFTLIYPLIIYLFYYPLYYFSTIKQLNPFLTYTTLTTLYKRYKEPETKRKDLKR